ncbi:Uncharacterised protein [Escherichia coli]|nr:Uncharacterised protein [Escherichia coli]CTR41993.1 Uncharacterised protein [Escherichia coli]CTR46740.1 Uncharacterised protein [Escherichia coli]CTY07927.1 Uncharacterised protein [Escherichia coli]
MGGPKAALITRRMGCLKRYIPHETARKATSQLAWSEQGHAGNGDDCGIS